MSSGAASVRGRPSSWAIVAKAYIRPDGSLFAGILFKGLTAELTLRTEAFTRFHASGATSPVPCFQWGVDAGMKVSRVDRSHWPSSSKSPRTTMDIEHRCLLFEESNFCNMSRMMSVRGTDDENVSVSRRFRVSFAKP